MHDLKFYRQSIPLTDGVMSELMKIRGIQPEKSHPSKILGSICFVYCVWGCVLLVAQLPENNIKIQQNFGSRGISADFFDSLKDRKRKKIVILLK